MGIWQATLPSASLILANLVLPARFDGDGQAFDLMRRSFSGDYRHNIVAIVKQHSATQGDITLRISRGKEGIRNTVLAPLRMQGEESFDDGKVSKRFLPDERLVLIQPSTRASGESTVRLKALEKNYTLSSEAGATVAGRKTVLVKANPAHPGKDRVEIWFDSESGFPLKRRHGRGQQWITDYETHSIEHPKTIDRDQLQLVIPKDARVQQLTPRKKIASIKAASDYLGFTPFEPKALPLGYQISGVSLTTDEDWKAISIRATDGLMHVTIYQWKPSPGENVTSRGSRLCGMRNNIRVMVVSDGVTWIRQQILDSFLAHSEIEPLSLSPNLISFRGTPGQ